MKKLFLLLAIFTLLIAPKAKAASWAEFGPKMYYDQNTIEIGEYAIHFWMKALWGAPVGPKYHINGKQPWYQLTKITVSCSRGGGSLTVGRTITYDLHEKKLAEYTGQDTYEVYPDSVAEVYFVNTFCPLAYDLRRQNGTENRY